MNTMTIDPRFVPAQLNLMMTRRPVRRVRNKRQQVTQRVINWLQSWQKTMIAELAALGAGMEKAL
jgi:hypothetical protein